MHTQPLTESQKGTLLSEEVCALMQLFAHHNLDLRIVGGAVRNVLMGLPVKDRDFATPATPQVLCALFKANAIRVIERGASLAHGTTIVIFRGQVIELTTLRCDIETNGRHAKVVFTDSWEKDANRRDFTINALYVDGSGTLSDYVGGLHDINQGLVRFIGNAQQRIQEDTLRLLRFFRFYALYQKDLTEPDQASWVACVQHASNLSGLSGERVWNELRLLLEAPRNRLVPTLKLMDKAHVFHNLFPNNTLDTAALDTPLADIPYADSVLKLAALAHYTNLGDLAMCTRLSGAARKRFHNLEHDTPLPDVTPPTLRQALYRKGSLRYVADALFKYAAPPPVFDSLTPLQASLPPFPVQASDLPTYAGPALGEKLKALKNKWVESDFTLSKEKLLDP